MVEIETLSASSTYLRELVVPTENEERVNTAVSSFELYNSLGLDRVFTSSETFIGCYMAGCYIGSILELCYFIREIRRYIFPNPEI